MSAIERPEINEAIREELRRDEEVIVHRRKQGKPIRRFESAIRVVIPVSALELLGRCDDDEDGEQ